MFCLIFFADLDNKYPNCPSNIQLPMPYIHHSQSLDGIQHATENKEIHTKGRKIASELALIAHFLFVRGHRTHVIALEMVVVFLIFFNFLIIDIFIRASQMTRMSSFIPIRRQKKVDYP